jgi:hypothetical protein
VVPNDRQDVSRKLRRLGLTGRTRELVALAVDAHLSHAALRAFEAALTSDPLPEIVWEKSRCRHHHPTPSR